MKKTVTYILVLFIGLGLLSCKKDNDEKMASSKAGMEKLLADIYRALPMDSFNVNDMYTTLATNSNDCDYAVRLNGFWDYGKIRSINQFIQLVDVALEKGTIDGDTRDSMLGEALFARAYCYFAMVRSYGGVPIVTDPSESISSRSMEKDTWDFVIADLDDAIKLLPEEQEAGSYRATKWAALGLQSRVALYAASVSKYWGKASIPSSHEAVAEKLTYMQASYADGYFSKCLSASYQIISSGRFSLYGGATTSVSKAKENLTDLFLNRQDCELIFGRAAADKNDFDRLYSPNQAHAKGGSGGWGNYSVTSDLADLFDNYNTAGGRSDGTVKTRYDGDEDEFFSEVFNSNSTFDGTVDFIKYERLEEPFLKKDARFQAWVLYPGAEFRGINILAQGGVWVAGEPAPGFYSNDPHQVNGTSYYGLGSGDKTQVSAFMDMTKKQSCYWNCCFGLRKFLDPVEAPVSSAAPWYDIRYAEILLNYAEAYAESGKGEFSIAKKALNDIRHRAAFTDDIYPTLENILHERKVEFAFEGHESYTLHRRRSYLDARSGDDYRKHTLLPVLDLREGVHRYIFPRVNVFHGDKHLEHKNLDIDELDYYAAIPTSDAKTLVKNPIQD